MSTSSQAGMSFHTSEKSGINFGLYWFESSQTHFNTSRSFIYLFSTCFGHSIQPPSGRKHEYKIGNVCSWI